MEGRRDCTISLTPEARGASDETHRGGAERGTAGGRHSASDEKHRDGAQRQAGSPTSTTEPAAETPDRTIGGLAAAQYGLVTRAQLDNVGLGRGAIALRVRHGRLHRVHRGVYLVGHASSLSLARELAAVLAYGPTAVLSHRSAAWLWSLLPVRPEVVEVIVAGRERRPRVGVRPHLTRVLDARERTTKHGVPVTTPARTLLDLAAAASRRDLERAFEEALLRRLVEARALRCLIARRAPRQGTRRLRELLDQLAEPALTRSEAERRLLELVRAGGLPAPRTNARLHGLEVDMHWPRHRLVLEVDGFAYHSSPGAFERDRRRDAELAAAGVTVVRVTWRQIVTEPKALLARLAQALARREA